MHTLLQTYTLDYLFCTSLFNRQWSHPFPKTELLSALFYHVVTGCLCFRADGKISVVTVEPLRGAAPTSVVDLLPP